MENCCNDHDICYDTCNKDKELCDLDFKRCLYNYCETHEKTTVGSIVAKGCKAGAKMLFTGTMTLGCRSYLDAQERSCFCPPPKYDSKNGKYGNNGKYDNKNGNYDGKNGKNKKYSKAEYERGTPPPAGWNVN